MYVQQHSWFCVFSFQGVEEADGEDYNVEAVEDGPRPFYCLLDTGLKRTSTGSKVFAALKVGCQ
jgi:large subunit ribosomal protein L5e